jgi:putative ABC transport system permease protein
MLTTNFIVILLLCTAGFLIYWILSIQSRTLQFGIFRAMGMSMREIITMLISEQVLISGTAVGLGFTAGILTSKIFVPLVQETYMPTQQHIPMEAVSLMSDMVRLIVVIGLMILVCLGIIAWIVSKIRISQALKLGED